MNTEPVQGAEIVVNGKTAAATSNARFKRLRPGMYKVEARATRIQDGRVLMGEGTAEVEAGRTSRLTVQLTSQAIEQEAATSTPEPVAATEAQKSVLDYYTAINNKDYFTAYSYLTEAQKVTFGSYFKFKRSWLGVQSVKVTKLQSIKAEAGREEFHVDLSVNSVGADNAATAAEQKLAITATGVPQAGSTLWKLEGFGGY